jgi:hypothetical protein
MGTDKVCLETTKKYYRVDRREIGYLRFILESYDGVAMLTTVDPRAGIVILCIAPGCLSEAEMLIGDLKREILIEELEDLETNSC